MFESGQIAALQTALQQSKAPFADCRLERTSERTLVVEDGEVVSTRQGLSCGGNLRLRQAGSWGFISFSGEDLPPDAFSAAHATAAVGEQSAAPFLPAPVVRDRWRGPLAELPPSWDANAITRLLVGLSRSLREHAKGIRSRVEYQETTTTKLVVNSEGSIVEQTNTVLAFILTASLPGVPPQVAVTATARHLPPAALLHAEARRVARQLLIGADPPSVPADLADVILDPELTGIWVHEAIGHLAEADSFPSRAESIWARSAGQIVAPESVTIVDDGRRWGQCGCWAYDDEGTPSHTTPLVQAGRLTQGLHSRATASAWATEPTGNARALHYRFPPLVRMTCTCLLPGDRTLTDLVGEVRHGYLLRGHRGGQNDLQSISLTSQEAFEIKDGRVVRRIAPLTVLGSGLQSLTQVNGLSRYWRLSGAAGPMGCGKLDQAPLPVSYGGPFAKLDGMLVISAR